MVSMEFQIVTFIMCNHGYVLQKKREKSISGLPKIWRHCTFSLGYSCLRTEESPRGIVRSR